MKIVVCLPNSVRAFSLQPEQLSALRERYPQHEFVQAAGEEAFVAELSDAGACLTWRFDAVWYEKAPKLVLVATPAAGRERVAPDPSGRARTLHGAYHGKIMAESLLGMMLFWSRRFDLALSNRRARKYERDQFSNTRRLSSQQALIVGFGPLGRECAKKLKAFGMKVVGVRRNPDADSGPADAVLPASMLHALLAQADHVIVTLPSDTGTDHLFDLETFRFMRKSAYFYNLGRGNAVDESALVQALDTGLIAGAFLDVFEREPLPADSALWTAPNLEFLPHASAISREYLDLWVEEITPALDALA